MNKKIRLDKFIASQIGVSRTDAKKMIRGGAVTVNGSVEKSADMSVDTSSDTVACGGKPIGFKKHIYIMLNKPQGIVSASRSEDERTVVDLVPAELFRKGLFLRGGSIKIQRDLCFSPMTVLLHIPFCLRRIMYPKHILLQLPTLCQRKP